MLELSPFFRISLMIAVLNDCVKEPRVKAVLAYFSNGFRNMNQNLLMNDVLIPSMPDADLQFAPSREISSSSAVKSASSRILSSSDNFRIRVKGCSKISGPKKVSIQPSRFAGSFSGLLKELAKKIPNISFLFDN